MDHWIFYTEEDAQLGVLFLGRAGLSASFRHTINDRWVIPCIDYSGEYHHHFESAPILFLTEEDF